MFILNKHILTVGELKKALENVPDDLEVRLSSDTGVDQSEDGEIIVESAKRVTYKLPNGQKFDDGTDGEDYFSIYCNDVYDEDEDDYDE